MTWFQTRGTNVLTHVQSVTAVSWLVSIHIHHCTVRTAIPAGGNHVYVQLFYPLQQTDCTAAQRSKQLRDGNMCTFLRIFISHPLSHSVMARQQLHCAVCLTPVTASTVTAQLLYYTARCNKAIALSHRTQCGCNAAFCLARHYQCLATNPYQHRICTQPWCAKGDDIWMATCAGRKARGGPMQQTQ